MLTRSSYVIPKCLANKFKDDNLKNDPNFFPISKIAKKSLTFELEI
jgi:hypothetical protein